MSGTGPGIEETQRLPRAPGLVCASTTAARAYLAGLERACRLMEEYDAHWGTDTAGHRAHVAHEAEMFRANWETRNRIRLGGDGADVELVHARDSGLAG